MLDFSFIFQILIDTVGRFSWKSAFDWLATALGLALYVLLIWNFYRFVARRDIFHHHLLTTPPGLVGLVETVMDSIIQFIKYAVVFPLISFIWFGGYSILLFVIAKSQSIEQTVLISIAVISGARILSYYNQDAAQELAKMLPMVILGVALVDPAFFQFDVLYSRLLQLPQLGETILQFAIYLSLLEIFLRVMLALKEAAMGKSPMLESNSSKKVPSPEA